MSGLEDFITSCTITFKAFDFKTEISKSKAKIWHFIAENPRNDKKYAVYCVPEIKKIKSLVKIAIRKLPALTRLVIITPNHDDEDLAQSFELGYTLLTLEILNQFGQEMLTIREDQSVESPIKEKPKRTSLHDELPPETLIDEIFEKEKLF